MNHWSRTCDIYYGNRSKAYPKSRIIKLRLQFTLTNMAMARNVETIFVEFRLVSVENVLRPM